MSQNQKRIRILGIILLVVICSAWLWLSRQYVAPVFMYHHISSEEGYAVHTVSPERFAEQMKYLSQNGYHVISAGEYADFVIAGKRLPRKSVVLTFDDGYEDNYSIAFPILKQYGFRATFFILAQYVGKEGQMTVAQIKEMAAAGMEIGSHTRTHEYLPDVTDPVLLIGEIAGSKKMLEEALSLPIDLLCYPVGGYSYSIQEDVRKAGYRAAFTTNRGKDFQNTDPWALTRIKVTDKDRGFILGAKLSGFYNIVRTPRKPDQSMHDEGYEKLFVEQE